METLSSNEEEADIHKMGLQQMVKANGGLQRLGLGGFLSHTIVLYGLSRFMP